jgi:hydrogenase maturation protease
LKVLVLGLGNYLMGDEGIGVHAARKLEAMKLPLGVDVVDGGTGGFHLLSYLRDYPTVMMIDACMDGKEPGTISILRPHFVSDFPRSLSAHDIGLRDLVESAALLGPLPEMFLITVSISAFQFMSTELSPQIAAVLQPLSFRVLEILDSLLLPGASKIAPSVPA